MLTEKLSLPQAINQFVMAKMQDLRFIRLVLITAVCLGSLAVPQLLGLDRIFLLLAALIGLGAVVLFIQNPMIGLVSIVVNALIIPSPPLPSNINLSTIHLVMLIGLWVVDHLVHKKEFDLVDSPTLKPLYAMVVVALVSFFTGQLSWFQFAQPAPIDAQIGGLAIFILTVAAYFIVAQQVRDLIWLKIMVFLYIGVAFIHVLGWFVEPVATVANMLFTNGTINSSMFWLWLGTLAFGQILFNHELKLNWRVALIVVAALTFYISFYLNTDWKSGYLPLLASIGTLLAMRFGRGSIILIVLAIGPAIVVIQEAIASDTYSYSTRIEAWEIVLEMLKTNPLLGFGPANYYWYTPLFPIRGYSVVFNSHNQYIDIMAQIGLLGLLCFVIFVVLFFRFAWQMRSRVADGFSRAYVHTILAGLIGMLASGMLVDWFIPFVYNIGFAGFRTSMLTWMFLGGLVALDQIHRQQAAAAADGDSTGARLQQLGE